LSNIFSSILHFTSDIIWQAKFFNANHSLLQKFSLLLSNCYQNFLIIGKLLSTKINSWINLNLLTNLNI